ncbi:MAG: hypothetical protein AB1717_02900 [Pseudomonadota bacterium]
MDSNSTIKTRDIRLRGPHPGLSEDDVAWLLSLSGILQVESPRPTRIRIRYDLERICLHGILQLLAWHGLHLDASLWSKLSYALIEYSEDAQREDLHIPIGTHEALRTLAKLREPHKQSNHLPDDPKHTAADHAWNRYL